MSHRESLRQTDKMDSSVARYVLSGLPSPLAYVCILPSRFVNLILANDYLNINILKENGCSSDDFDAANKMPLKPVDSPVRIIFFIDRASFEKNPVLLASVCAFVRSG